ncbi:Fe3+-citrate ABC transporter substrate-binding protein [Mycobacterium sp. 1274756.6]|nr:Fe3+-citrate ABC transporter substrate-binding protein [Mycobacterium sp. 1274756.6]
MLGLGLAFTAGCATDTAGERAPSTSVITSTTMIAGAGVLGNQRRPDESCAAEPAPAEPGPGPVDNAEGIVPATVEVPADPQRIVVLAGDQLDALCALGLQSRIVAAAEQPSYLGTVIHDLPAVGSPDAPDLAAISAADPDLNLGSAASTPELYPRLAEIAPTVFTAAPGARWQSVLRAVAAATGRAGAADGLLDGFAELAARVAAKADTAHYQASIVQFTDDRVRIFGAVNFPASVLKEAGLDRPPAQRFTDRPFIEVDTTDLDGADFSAADADIVYVSFATATAKERAPQIFDSTAWRALSATYDNRVFVVNNEVWQAGQNLVAARGILDDLQWVNAPIN